MIIIVIFQQQVYSLDISDRNRKWCLIPLIFRAKVLIMTFYDESRMKQNFQTVLKLY
jgi:hypothetical protein